MFSEPFTDEVDITNGGFSAEGDSGSLVVTQDTADAVGLLATASGNWCGSSSQLFEIPPSSQSGMLLAEK